MEAKEYQIQSNRTSRINWDAELGPDVAILGVVGEYGSLATVVKKKIRDGEAYSSFDVDFCEELGDILWYVIAIASRLGIELSSWASFDESEVEGDLYSKIFQLQDELNEVYKLKAALRDPSLGREDGIESWVVRVIVLLKSLSEIIDMKFDTVAKENCHKILSYWAWPNSTIPAREFDRNYPWYEKLPRSFEIEFYHIEKDNSQLIIMNGLAIGDRLTDNSFDDDGYRYHDVFHMAAATTLGWSPVFRRMLKRKRKSDPKIDNVEDGARAAIVEEAIINHIYDFARPDFLKGVNRIDLDLLKRISNLARGYEVSQCEYWEWQDYILRSYEIFRKLLKNNGGVVEFNSDKRSMNYRVSS